MNRGEPAKSRDLSVSTPNREGSEFRPTAGPSKLPDWPHTTDTRRNGDENHTQLCLLVLKPSQIEDQKSSSQEFATNEELQHVLRQSG